MPCEPETQALEDVACLVFLENYFAEFAARHDEPKVLGILGRTWRKMSPQGRAAAQLADLTNQAGEGIGQLTSLLADMRAGLRYVWNWPGLMVVCVMATLINFLLTDPEVGAIFEQETGRNIYDALESDLARPIGMEDWDRSAQRKSVTKPPASRNQVSSRTAASRSSRPTRRRRSPSSATPTSPRGSPFTPS